MNKVTYLLFKHAGQYEDRYSTVILASSNRSAIEQAKEKAEKKQEVIDQNVLKYNEFLDEWRKENPDPYRNPKANFSDPNLDIQYETWCIKTDEFMRLIRAKLRLFESDIFQVNVRFEIKEVPTVD